MWAGRGMKGWKDRAAWGLHRCWGKRLSDGAGTLGQQAHSALGKCQGLSTILFLSQCARLPPAFLSLCSSPSFPAGLWDCSQHPQLLASARTRACPGYACTDQAQLADVPGGPAFDQKPPLHPHPHILILTPAYSSLCPHPHPHHCILILTPAPSSSPPPSTRRSSVQPHCALASLALP